MKFFDIRSYILCYVYIVYLCNLSTIGAYHVRLFVAVTSFVFRCVAELMVYNQIRIYKQRNCVVNSCTAHSELFLLFEHLQQVVDFKVPIEGIYRIQYGIAFRRAPTSVLL